MILFIGSKRLTVIDIYRPLSSPDLSHSQLIQAFYSNLHNLLSNAPSNTFVLLDSNINLAADNIESLLYHDTFTSRGFTNAITLPTRVNETSSTSIDQLLFNSPLISGSCGTVHTDLSDHLPTFINFNLAPNGLKNNKAKLKRSYSETNMVLFENLLSNLNWNFKTQNRLLINSMIFGQPPLNLAFRLNVSPLIGVLIK